jgi:myo-inositol-1(or 4)-monophosphatase
MLDLLYAAAIGQGATCNGNPSHVSQQDQLQSAKVLAAKPNLAPIHWRGGQVPEFTRSYRPSLAYRLAHVADGRSDAMLTLRPSWEWDIAAGALIIAEAGGACCDRHGRALEFNNPHPQLDGVVGANGMLQPAFLAALDPAGGGIGRNTKLPQSS